MNSDTTPAYIQKAYAHMHKREGNHTYRPALVMLAYMSLSHSLTSVIAACVNVVYALQKSQSVLCHFFASAVVINSRCSGGLAATSSMGQAVTVANASGDTLYVKVQSSLQISEKADFTVSGSTPSTDGSATGRVDVEVCSRSRRCM